MPQRNGFSLIELIITLVILGILAVTILPKILTPEDFDSYTLRDQAISALRTTQLRALQNTDSASCHKLYVSQTLIAPPEADNCSGSPNENAPDYLVVQITPSATNTRFITRDSNGAVFNQIQFDAFGRTNVTPNCSTGCTIAINETQLCISGEGFIYAC